MKKLLLSKGMVIALSVIVISLLSIVLYNSYATSSSVTLGNDENTYDILLNESINTVTVPSKSSKTVYYQFSNTNKGTVKYSIGYTSNNVIAKVWWDTKDPISDTIDYGEYKFIKLKLINDTTSDDTITIKPVLGYVNGGDLVVPNNTTLVTGTINKTNTMSITPSTALATLGIDKTAVEEISFVKDNIVPSDALGSTNMNNDGSIKLWYIASDTEGMYKIYIGSDNGITSFPNNSTTLLSGFTNMSSVKQDNIDTSNVTNMYQMYYNDKNLVDIDFSNFDTNNVENMSNMFYNCSSVTELNLDSFYTPKLKGSLNWMFLQCSKLEKISFKNIDTSRITSMSAMFQGCTNLTKVDLSDLDTSSVTNMSQMFQSTRLSLINIDTSSAQNMSSMFYQSTATTLDLSTFNTHEVTNMNSMFNGAKGLKSLDLSNFYTPKLTRSDRMFYNMTIKQINLSNFTLGSTNVSEMFSANNNLLLLDMRNADFSDTTNNTSLFSSGVKTATIYLKDTQFNRDFMSNNYSSFTNVQYIA